MNSVQDKNMNRTLFLHASKILKEGISLTNKSNCFFNNCKNSATGVSKDILSQQLKLDCSWHAYWIFLLWLQIWLCNGAVLQTCCKLMQDTGLIDSPNSNLLHNFSIQHAFSQSKITQPKPMESRICHFSHEYLNLGKFY